MDIAGDTGGKKSKGAVWFVKIALLFSAVLVLSYYFITSGFPALAAYKASDDGSDSTEGHNDELAAILERAANPNKTVIITYLNHAWTEPGSVFDLLLESFRAGNNTEPLLKHVVAVSLDPKAHAQCLAVNVSSCYFLRLHGFDFENEAYFMTPMYKEMMWKRLNFMHAVLSLGYNFLFTDADIMWFRDPFPHLVDDAHFQIACDQYNERPTDVRNQPNAGFMYVKSNKHTILFYKLWYHSRRLYPKNNEQEVFNIIKFGPLFRIIGLKVRFLDTKFFGGFCEPSRDFGQVCTMHANCCYGLIHKVNDLNLILGDWRRYSSLTPPQTAPYPFKWSAPKMC